MLKIVHLDDLWSENIHLCPREGKKCDCKQIVELGKRIMVTCTSAAPCNDAEMHQIVLLKETPCKR